MAMVVSAICNDGVMKTPYLVSEVRSADLRVLYRHGPDEKQAMSASSGAGVAADDGQRRGAGNRYGGRCRA